MKKILTTPLNVLYFLLVVIFMFSYITIDFNTNCDSSVLKFSLVITVSIYVLIVGLKYIIKKENIKINILYLLAVLFTLISDYFLLILDDYHAIGVTTFIIAHFMYSLIIYYLNDKRDPIKFFIEKLVLLIIAIIGLVTTKQVFVALASFYALNLIMNTIHSLILLIKTKKLNAVFLFIGYVFFVGCDICVLISNIDQIVDATQKIVDMENLCLCIIWIFYGPSQYFLGLSINRGDLDEEKCA